MMLLAGNSRCKQYRHAPLASKGYRPAQCPSARLANGRVARQTCATTLACWLLVTPLVYVSCGYWQVRVGASFVSATPARTTTSPRRVSYFSAVPRFSSGDVEAAQLKVQFEPSEIGVGADYSSGYVQDVPHGGQADRLGVRVGMRFLSVAGKPYSETELDAAIAGGKSFEVVLAQVGIGFSPWVVFGLRKGVDKTAIKSRFKELASIAHPDKNPGDAAAASRFKQITVAYRELIDGTAVREENEAAYRKSKADAANEMRDVVQDVGLDVQDVRQFLTYVQTFAIGGGGLFVLVIGYFLLFAPPEELMDIVFPDATKQREGSVLPKTDEETKNERLSTPLKKQNEWIEAYLKDY